MYLTQSDLVNLKIMEGKTIVLSDALRDLIRTHERSDEKKAMKEGTEYYRLKNKILNYDFRKYYVDGSGEINKNASNERIVHGYHRILVDQKVFYIASKEPKFGIDNPALEKLYTPLMGNDFHKTIKRWITGTSNRGIEFLHPFVNRHGNFDYVIISGEEVIPIYDTRFQKELIGAIRYYQVDVKENLVDIKKKRYMVEIWDQQKVLFYRENENGKFVKDTDQTNPRYHFYGYNSLRPDDKTAISWGRVPYIPLKNNDTAMTDLQLVKTMIDSYDFNVSDMSNKLVDIANAIWVLAGYEGTSLAEFTRNLKQYNAIKVKKLGAVEPKTLDLNNDASNSHLDRVEDNIFVFGMGVNPKIDKFGNSPSGIALKYFYSLLDLKSNATIAEADSALDELDWYACEYIKHSTGKVFNPDDISHTFDKSLIVNESEIAEIAAKSKGIISDETILEHHPWVKDVEEEKRRLENQRKEYESQFEPLPEEVDEDS